MATSKRKGRKNDSCKKNKVQGDQKVSVNLMSVRCSTDNTIIATHVFLAALLGSI
jgi:hypothetical protein